ncbi:gamma carbonic anhydrase family protein [Streptomyces sp. NBC_01803]|uniref:gamma carbonic anhydrase family protein n=1 Tax=Streptomyces sp. NBC_01803 TaxID=2975946 RepID=UPI002DD897B8|nr:gamma carbonic anhydrase family protein [Streptomyces sp. NBC_01803]WSA45923.1 gamma carbonic anhydrase family protein [Streptomyces sp. NBC_01803]
MTTTLIPFDGHRLELAPGAWVAPTATAIGAVRLGRDASLWYGAVVRADAERVEIGDGSNVQDGCVLHADPGFPALVGAGVSIGHRAVVHGCVVEDDVLIGMGAVILNGAHVGRGSLIAAGAVVLAGTQVPPGSLVAGVPGKVRRELGEDETALIRLNADHYRDLARRHAGLPAAGA